MSQFCSQQGRSFHEIREIAERLNSFGLTLQLNSSAPCPGAWMCVCSLYSMAHRSAAPLHIRAHSVEIGAGLFLQLKSGNMRRWSQRFQFLFPMSLVYGYLMTRVCVLSARKFIHTDTQKQVQQYSTGRCLVPLTDTANSAGGRGISDLHGGF